VRPLETIRALGAFERRGPGTDAERRAARWLARELLAQRHRLRIEPFWCRPNWALAHAWHLAAALAGSLLSIGHPTLGAAVLVAALISIGADGLFGISPGRRLTPERASQNVVASPPAVTHEEPDVAAHPAPPSVAPDKATLIITANYDAGRTALVYRDPFRRAAAGLRRLAGPAALGWLAWLSIAVAWLAVIAVVRTTTPHPSSTLGALQLPPTVALVLGLALLLEAAGAAYGPAAGDNGSGTAVAIALARVLAAAPPRHLTPTLVLQGAGEGHEIGLRRYLKTHRHELRPANAIVLGIAPCGAGHPRWWLSDGRLLPIPSTRRLREIAATVAADHPHLNAQAHRGRGATPALRARARRLPAIAIGSLDRKGLASRSHQPGDAPDHIDPHALDRAIEFGLILISTIDAALDPAPTPANTEQAATPA
jgi:Peptidase family M28